MKQWLSLLHKRMFGWAKENTLSSILVVVIALQVPFTALYFTSKPQAAVINQVPSAKQKADSKKATKSADDQQLLPSRPDPFMLLPGMELEQRDQTANQAGIPTIYDAFGGQPSPKPEGLPVLPAPAGLDGKADAPSTAVGTQLKPAPVQPLPVAPSCSVKLTGVARFHGKAVAIFQFRDKSTVHTFEGERLSGTDCLVQTILSNKVFLRYKANGQNEQDWLFVGEECQV